jgi:hypothetical protein
VFGSSGYEQSKQTSWSDSMPFSLSIVCPWSVVSPAMVQYVCRSDMIEVGKTQNSVIIPKRERAASLYALVLSHCYIFTYFVAACCSMHFQCLNGAFQLVSPPMRTVVGKPYVSPKAFSVSRRSQVVRPASERTLERTTYAQFFTLDHSTTSSLTDFPCPVVAKFQL